MPKNIGKVCEIDTFYFFKLCRYNLYRECAAYWAAAECMNIEQTGYLFEYTANSSVLSKKGDCYES